MPGSFDGFCSLWPRADPGGRMRGSLCILPSAIFKNVFDAYNFSIILNLFDSDKPKASIIENVRTKCIIFGEVLRIRVKKFKQSLPEKCSKLQYVIFQNFPGEAYPRTP